MPRKDIKGGKAKKFRQTRNKTVQCWICMARNNVASCDYGAVRKYRTWRTRETDKWHRQHIRSFNRCDRRLMQGTVWCASFQST